MGGDHSVSYSYCKALSDSYASVGVLQCDAHMDLRKDYAGFSTSHASVMQDILTIESVSSLVQVGIRDCCQEEVDFQKNRSDIHVFYDSELKMQLYNGKSWDEICNEIVSKLPDYIYVSTDIDGLDVRFCPSTGTPVPGGLDFSQWCYLLKKVKDAGKTIIGIDLVEVVSKTTWDANVAARLLYFYGTLI